MKGVLDHVQRVIRAHAFATRERGQPARMIASKYRNPISAAARHMSVGLGRDSLDHYTLSSGRCWNGRLGTGVEQRIEGYFMNRLATCVAVAALAACQNKSLIDDWPYAARSTSEDKAAEAKGVDAPPKRDPLTGQKLSPVIHELAAENAVPTAVVIQLAAPIIDRADV